ncbi:acyltransferase family protein [Bacillus alkalicellulosilyticus]|uniref:acyltransferase family protein n=1 Tax=Alkalihalobacterium alkalicellulosilyticum TaxID=1912214 RepID=UPI0014832E84|nr:acyltransferase family protein [Bacillus alkalicellulosilyticus]
MRSVACLCIVFLHAVALGLESVTTLSVVRIVFDSVNILLYFGTPLFIFISVFILAYSYRNRNIPEAFLQKRITYIFIPFLAMAFFYSIPHASSLEAWGVKLLMNAVVGDFHGYFVLIIFQFYILHLLLHTFLKRTNPYVVISVSLIINGLYLSIFHFTTPPDSPYATYIWERFYWVPFFGWLFYYSLGFYCGYHYKSFRAFLHRIKYVIIVAPIVSSFLLLSFYHFEVITVHSSKRIDLLFHTTAVGFFLFYIATRVKKIPPLLIIVSQYSFGIYLLHMFYIHLVGTILSFVSIQVGILYIPFLFLFSLISSVITVHYLSKLKYGVYIVGKIGARYQVDKIGSIKPKEKQKNKIKRAFSIQYKGR